MRLVERLRKSSDVRVPAIKTKMPTAATAPPLRKLGHSFSKGVVNLYQSAIVDPTNSGVSLLGCSVSSTPTADYNRVHLNLSSKRGYRHSSRFERKQVFRRSDVSEVSV
jgi:hypothetical protein